MFSSCLIEKSGGNGRSVNASDVKQLMHERPGLTFIRRKEYECMSGCGCSVGECECSVGAGSKKLSSIQSGELLGFASVYARKRK